MNPAATSPRDASRSYALLGLIAEGGMGFVELVVRREGQFERLYARKRLHPHVRADAAFRAMFMDEARLAGSVHHRNVVSVLDIGEDEDGPFLIMQLVEGVPVSRLIENALTTGRRVPAQIAVRVALEAARGLEAAHEARAPDGTLLGLVHRDVTPQNVLVGFDGGVAVTDFGIAKAFGNTSRTRTGVLKGNLSYLSPEQLRFERPTPRSDLFSLGVILHELLAGAWLYPGGDDFEGPRRILNEPPPDVGQDREDVPAELVELLFEMLAKDPAERPESARAVVTRLEGLLANLMDRDGPLELRQYLRERFADERIANDERLARWRETLGRQRAEPVPVALTPWRRWWLVTGPVALGLLVAVLALRGRGPSPPAPGGGPRTVWANGWHTCAMDKGRLWCWGKNNERQLGIETTTDVAARWSVSPAVAPTAVALGKFHTCACTGGGQVLCWGRSVDGQAGAPIGGTVKAPRVVPGAAGCRQLTAGHGHTCMLGSDGRVSCWGRNDRAQLGRTAPAVSAQPEVVPGLTDVEQIEAGGDFTCARRKDRTAWCWGSNEHGQLGEGVLPSRAAPAPVPGLADVAQIEAGYDFACAIGAGGVVSCWGWNAYHQLGDGLQGERKGQRPRPAPVVGLTGAVQLAAGEGHVCALRGDGQIWCWGAGWFGGLGDGAMDYRRRPVRVIELKDAYEVTVGSAHSCARYGTGGLVCWGYNQTGQLGDATREDRSAPVSVSGFGG